ncbi:Genome sequencing data, contig C317 [Microcystis aeruginosa PCC 9432]|jgi:GT2 family glycosyltransferase|uniref:Genome sequencing data, contig C317 n=1 Tax=Microcystis aeruginosa PCC 9432 TaxID=1160280 RepID=A0A822LDP7_MICAE|nr:glycosyltransferase [Microcystis aeruginosa]MBE9247196.1 glycosyltransferase [Microcystis aeruginosa LEGE 00239]CCH94293.1 Genome sequencing data, contig C317 [Microcystis aeruginosa PCC 9432]
MQLTASLVLYKNDPEIVTQAIKSLFSTPIEINLSVVDNSPTDELKKIFDDFQEYDIDYYFNNGNNVGFSKAQNLAIARSKNYDYHLVMNPDIYFDSKTIIELIDYLGHNLDIGLIQPKILYPNGEIQYLCKRNPTFLALFMRRFIPKQLASQSMFKKYMDWYEMRETGYDKIMDVSYLSGCFMLFRRQYLEEIGYFDENIFMYLEDADITLRMAEKYRSVFYPNTYIYHYWARGSQKSLKLTWVTIQSAFYYFSKYGWKFW